MSAARRRTSLSHGVTLGLALLSLVASHLPAEICAVDAVPAASLLVPHFQVDLAACEDPDGLSTVITLVNSQAASTVAHMTLWTDWALPTLDVSIYLTGFDVETIDLRELFCSGVFPLTGPTIHSPHGAMSDPAPALPTCEAFEPFLMDPLLTGSLLDRIRNAHTGQFDESFPGCAGADHGDSIARGYATFDVVRDCTASFPSDPGYFDFVAGFDNVLLGEYYYTVGTPTEGRHQAYNALHLEAAEPGTFGAGDPTFYGRYVGGDGRDRREPLPSLLAAHTSIERNAEGELLMWRESPPGVAVECGQTPPGFLLPAPEPFVFDTRENVVQAVADFSLATGAVALADFSVEDGWMLVDARHDGLADLYGADVSQAWLTSWSAPGAPDISAPPPEPLVLPPYDATYAGDSLCPAQGSDLPFLLLDGFESGDVSRWQ